jgi:outer membrane protein assembly factor BamB
MGAVLFMGVAALLVPAAGQPANAPSSPPSLSWSPTTSTPPPTYDFGTQSGPVSQQFALTNSGGSATSALKVTVSPSPGPFTITADACTRTSLGPKKSCKVTVQYAPTTGNGDTATMTATSNKPLATANISLTGSGAVDWPMFHNTLDRGGWNPSEHVLSAGTVAGLAQKWAVTTGDIVFSSPAVVNGVVYVGSFDHKVYALDAATGAVEWTTTTGGAVESSPAVANGVVYIGAWDDHTVYALDAGSGATLWTQTTGGYIYPSPAVANGVLYIGSGDAKMYAFALPG